jgi:hypothetical protein
MRLFDVDQDWRLRRIEELLRNRRIHYVLTYQPGDEKGDMHTVAVAKDHVEECQQIERICRRTVIQSTELEADVAASAMIKSSKATLEDADTDYIIGLINTGDAPLNQWLPEGAEFLYAEVHEEDEDSIVLYYTEG